MEVVLIRFVCPTRPHAALPVVIDGFKSQVLIASRKMGPRSGVRT